MHADRGDLSKRPDHVKGEVESVRVAYHFEHDVCTAAARSGFDFRNGVVVEVNGDSADAFRFFEALGHGVDYVDFVDHGEGCGNGADPHGSAADADDGELFAVAVGEVFEVTRGGEVAGGEDVGHEDEHFFRDIFGSEDESGVGERAADVLGLAAVDGVSWGGVAEEFAWERVLIGGWRMGGMLATYLWNNEMLAHGRSRSIRRTLYRKVPRPAMLSQHFCSKPTSSSQHHLPPAKSSSLLRRPSLSPLELAYLVSDIELLYIVSLLDDLAHKLMTTDEVWWALEVATVEMQVAAA